MPPSLRFLTVAVALSMVLGLLTATATPAHKQQPPPRRALTSQETPYPNNLSSTNIHDNLVTSRPPPPRLHQDYDYSSDDSYDYCQATFPTAQTYPPPPVQGSTLINVQLFIRHGDRTPLEINPRNDVNVTWNCSQSMPTYASSDSQLNRHQNTRPSNIQMSIPNDSPFRFLSWDGSCTMGQLTPRGALQQETLGHHLREIYVDQLKFLPDQFDGNLMYLRSTDVWRTRQSGEHLITGLYPPSTTTTTTIQEQGEGQESSGDMATFHVYPSFIETLVANDGCPKVRISHRNLVNNSPVMKNLTESNKVFMERLSQLTDNAGGSWSQYVDITQPRICYGIPQPCMADNATDCLNDQDVNRILTNALIRDRETRRDAKDIMEYMTVAYGPLAQQIREVMDQAVFGQDSSSQDQQQQQQQQQQQHQKVQKFTLYSGHDETLTSILGLLKAYDMRWPPYASNMAMELWASPEPSNSRDQAKFHVRVLYNGQLLTAPWCDLAWCPLETFLNHLELFIVEDLQAACKV